MDTIKFEMDGKEHLVTFRKTEELNISDDELLALWAFDRHVERLLEFAKPFYNEMQISYSMPSNKKSTKNINIPTELRLSASINELRPFMLNKDSICFYKIRKIISKQFKNNREFSECMKWYKKFWDAYDINNKHENSAKIGTRYDIDKVSITTYSEILKVFMYGKYIHNGDNPKDTALVYRIEKSYFYPSIKADLGICVANICDILRIFNRDFVKPILAASEGRIRSLHWQPIN